ncbi:MAG: hypothetical protein O3A80_00035 [bacterium]|nr:hypothetical protein [bacterium]MDA1293033.1 hypothetical protein [bacterium]
MEDEFESDTVEDPPKKMNKKDFVLHHLSMGNSLGIQDRIHTTSQHLALYELMMINVSGFDDFGEEYTEIESFLAETSNADSPIPLLQKVKEYDAELAILAAHMFSEESRLITQTCDWFQETMHHLNSAHTHQYNFFDTVTNQLKDPLSIAFVGDWKTETEDLITATTSMATVFAIHAQEEDCALYFGETAHHLTSNKRSAPQQISTLASSRLFTSKHALHFYQLSSAVRGNIAKIPTIISVLDIEEYAKILDTFWTALAAKVTQKNSRSGMRINFRPTRNRDGQARMSFEIGSGAYKDFNIRIDLDEGGGRKKVCIDTGRIKWQQALAYAEELADISNNKEVITGYKDTLSITGAHIHAEDPRVEFPQYDTKFYPSVFRSNAITEINEQCALATGIVMNHGKDLNLFQGEIFGYHNTSTNLNKPEYTEGFARIVRNIRGVIRA